MTSPESPSRCKAPAPLVIKQNFLLTEKKLQVTFQGAIFELSAVDVFLCVDFITSSNEKLNPEHRGMHFAECASG